MDETLRFLKLVVIINVCGQDSSGLPFPKGKCFESTVPVRTFTVFKDLGDPSGSPRSFANHQKVPPAH